MNLDGFELVRSVKSGAFAKLGKNAHLGFSLHLVRTLNLDINEKHCFIRYNPKSRQVAVCLVTSEEPGTFRVCAKNRAGFDVPLRGLLKEFNLAHRIGTCPVHWEPKERIIIADLGEVVSDIKANRITREVKAISA